MLDWSGDLYDQVVAVELIDRFRDIRKFNGVNELKAQLASDMNVVRELVTLN